MQFFPKIHSFFKVCNSRSHCGGGGERKTGIKHVSHEEGVLVSQRRMESSIYEIQDVVNSVSVIQKDVIMPLTSTTSWSRRFLLDQIEISVICGTGASINVFLSNFFLFLQDHVMWLMSDRKISQSFGMPWSSINISRIRNVTLFKKAGTGRYQETIWHNEW